MLRTLPPLGILVSLLPANLMAATVFNIDSQVGPTDPTDLNSVELMSGVVYGNFITPISYQTISLAEVAEIRENTVTTATVSSPTFTVEATAAFQNQNLNHYQQVDAGNEDAQWQINYGTAFSVGMDALLVLTDRNSNNTYSIEALDVANNSLGTQAIALGSYEDTGAVSLSTNLIDTESIGASVFLLSDFTSLAGLTAVDHFIITNTSGDADGGDGKLLVFTAVPEPSSLSLLSLGLIATMRRKRR